MTSTSPSPVRPQTRLANWYFDFISPFAYLQWRSLGALRERIELAPRPILFAALLDHHGHKGPAEIPEKRRFTFRFVQWQADRLGIPLCCPPAHPFNPLPALRLAIALGNSDAVIDAIFTHIWAEGRPAHQISDLAPLAERFAITDLAGRLADPAVKAELRRNTEQAIAEGVFGVPTVQIDEQLFWGLDASAMLGDWLDDPGLFDTPQMRRIDQLPAAIERAR